MNRKWLKEFIDVYGIAIMLTIIGVGLLYILGAFDDISFLPKIDTSNATYYNATR